MLIIESFQGMKEGVLLRVMEEKSVGLFVSF